MDKDNGKTDKVPEETKNAVLAHSLPLPKDTPTVKGKKTSN